MNLEELRAWQARKAEEERKAKAEAIAKAEWFGVYFANWNGADEEPTKVFNTYKEAEAWVTEEADPNNDLDPDEYYTIIDNNGFDYLDY